MLPPEIECARCQPCTRAVHPKPNGIVLDAEPNRVAPASIVLAAVAMVGWLRGFMKCLSPYWCWTAQELAAEVEGVVSERLEVELRPANISMQPPSHAEHHLDLQELFSQGIHTEEVTHQVTAQVVDTVIERRYHVPLCKMGEYYVACPVTRSEIREIKETRVHLDPEKVRPASSTLLGPTHGNKGTKLGAHICLPLLPIWRLSPGRG